MAKDRAAQRLMGASLNPVRRRMNALAALGFAAFLLASCTQPAPAPPILPENEQAPRPYNVVIVLSDTLRADHLGCYGYERNTTPFLDTIAEEGLVFTNAYSTSSITRESVAALMAGQWASRSGATGITARPNSHKPNFARLFNQANYYTGFINNSPVLADPRTQFVDSLGFSFVSHMETRFHGGRTRQATEMTSQFIEHCEGQPFFAYTHFLNPHAPYRPTREYYLRFADKVFEAPLEVYADIQPRYEELMKEGFGPGDPRFEDLVIRYDAEIADVDDAVKHLFDLFKQRGVLDNTIFVFVADHGDEFLEHGFVGHGWTLYQEMLRVPLIVWAPGKVKPARIDGPVSLIDVLPTILTLMGMEYEASDFDGMSLVKPTGALFEPVDIPEDRVIVSELLVDIHGMMRSVVKGDYKLIHVYKYIDPKDRPKVFEMSVELARKRFWEVDQPLGLWETPTRIEFYRLENGKEIPVAPEEQPDIYRDLNDELQRFKDHCESYAEDRVVQSVPGDPMMKDLVEELKALGYVAGDSTSE